MQEVALRRPSEVANLPEADAKLDIFPSSLREHFVELSTLEKRVAPNECVGRNQVQWNYRLFQVPFATWK
jgi:hypothetical protein